MLNFSSRFWLFAPTLAVVGLAAAASIAWKTQADALDRKLDQINGHDAVPGITLSFAGKSISGFPFNMDVVLTGVVVAGQGAHGHLRWTSEKFALHRLTYGRRQDIYEAAGNQTLSWSDAGGKSHGLKFLPGSLRASMLADAKGLERFDLDMLDAGGSDSGGIPFTAARVQLHMRRDPKKDALDLMASGLEIKSKSPIAGLLGDHVANLSLYATLSQGHAFAPLLAGTQNWPDAAAAWQKAGGAVLIGPVAVQSAAVNLTANAFDDSGGDLKNLFGPLY